MGRTQTAHFLMAQTDYSDTLLYVHKKTKRTIRSPQSARLRPHRRLGNSPVPCVQSVAVMLSVTRSLPERRFLRCPAGVGGRERVNAS